MPRCALPVIWDMNASEKVAALFALVAVAFVIVHTLLDFLRKR